MDRPKTLVLIGASRLGKTCWARSLGSHMYFNNLFNLDDWNPEASYIIFDDISFDFIPAPKSFWGAQKSFVVTDKYRKKKTLSFGKPLIFLCNPEDDPTLSNKWSQWFEDNCTIVKITNKLY